ncbi:MAG: glutamate-5-semialdehyde dehydrogenase [Kiritimatiellae bacterium]|nr:glutamate-5-semialdehyde dehydrogenase [Kiritimatiellia bacterium]
MNTDPNPVSISRMAERAVEAATELARLSTRTKNGILEAMASGVEAASERIRSENQGDLDAAESAGLPRPMRDRLALTPARLDAMVRGMRALVGLKDPVGTRISRWLRPNGLEILKVRVPIGVIAIIYEARPNVTADAASLCFKTSNAVLLRGGHEAARSNRAILDAMITAARPAGLPDHAMQLVETPDRDAIREIVQQEGKVDLVVPRGGEGLIRFVTEHARVPVIKHYKGVCHIYVDRAAQPEMALDICENAKCSYPAVCNAAEKILIHREIADSLLPRLAERLRGRGVELRGDPEVCARIPGVIPATEADWTAEYLDLIITLKVVDGTPEAIAHINHYGSHHSDAIVTEHAPSARRFLREVDSAAVYHNASTRFTDGGEFGMGAELGISTDKLHARGPMGLDELTSYKYIIRGSGQIRSPAG